MKRSLYRKIETHACRGCDYPAYAPSKRINPKNACKKCRKNSTQRVKQGDKE